jgi:two-component sensor histidine kinase
VATPLAVVLVELVQNAVEHAFGPGGGTVVARMSQEPGFVRLLVEDDGEGLPEGFNLAESGLGLQIVRALVGSELHGKINISSGASNGGNRGVTAVVDIPLRIGDRQREG